MVCILVPPSIRQLHVEKCMMNPITFMCALIFEVYSPKVLVQNLVHAENQNYSSSGFNQIKFMRPIFGTFLFQTVF